MTEPGQTFSESDLDDWGPGAPGKGMLFRDASDELVVRAWTVDDEGWPFHYHGERALRPHIASVLCFFLVDPDGRLEVFQDELSGGQTYSTIITGLDQRLSVDPNDKWSFEGWEKGIGVRRAAVEEVASPLVLEELDAALAGAISVASELELPPEVVQGLADGSSLLPIPLDPASSWLARSVAWNTLQRFTLALPPNAGGRWLEVVAEHARPAADRVRTAVVRGELLPAEIATGLETSHRGLVDAWYRGEQEGTPWPLIEALVRLDYVYLRLEQLKDSESPIGGLVPKLTLSLNRDMNMLRNQISVALEAPESVPRSGVVTHATSVATLHEAVVDGLTHPRSAEVLLELHADGFLKRHQQAVRAGVGLMSGIPVVVASNDRWLAEVAAGAEWPGPAPWGFHVATHAIVLSGSTGELAVRQKADGLLNSVLIHELVHATQRPRVGAWQRPPYDARAMECERKLFEALTDYFTDRILARARSEWPGEGPNPYNSALMETRVYAGYIAVMLAAAEVAVGGEPDALLRELARSPHKLTLLTELLTGSYSRERKDALVETLEPLFALGYGVASSLHSLDQDLRNLATEELRNYRRAAETTRRA